MELSRVLRDTESNPVLIIIQTYLGPVFLVLQQAIVNVLKELTEAVDNVKSSELYGLISIILGSFNISLDNVLSIIDSLETNINDVFEILTGVQVS